MLGPAGLGASGFLSPRVRGARRGRTWPRRCRKVAFKAIRSLHRDQAKRWAIDLPDPIEAIRARMEQQNLRPKDLEPFLGPSGRVSEVLNRRRPLTLTMIRRLERGLGIPARILIRETVGRPTRGRAGRKRDGTHAAKRRSTGQFAKRR